MSEAQDVNKGPQVINSYQVDMFYTPSQQSVKCHFVGETLIFRLTTAAWTGHHLAYMLPIPIGFIRRL